MDRLWVLGGVRVSIPDVTITDICQNGEECALKSDETLVD
jgi:hypothetical protein